MAQDNAVIRLKLDTEPAKQSANELAAELRKSLGGIRIGTKLVDLSDASSQVGKLTTEVLKAKAALETGARSNELKKQAALLQENLRYAQELARIERSGLGNDQAETLRTLATELNRVNLDRLNQQFDALGQKIDVFKDASVQLDRLNAELLRTKAALASGDESNELRKQVALLQEASRYKQELARIDRAGISPEDAANAKKLADELNRINLDRITQQFDAFKPATDQLNRLNVEILRAKAALADGRESVELKRQVVLLQQAENHKRELARIDGAGFSPEDAANARDLAEELNRINVDRLNGEFDRLAKNASNRFKFLNGLVEQFKRGVANQAGERFFDAIISAAIAVPQQIGQVTLEFEKLQQTLRQSLGGADEAAPVFDSLKNFAERTPFELSEVTDAYVKLQNRALNPSIDMLRQLGDIAASQGKSLQQITEAVLDASQGQFRRLEELGIGVNVVGDKVRLSFQGIAKEVQNTGTEVTKAVLSFSELERVRGGMEALGRTLGGTLSTLTDNVKGAAFGLGEELTPTLLDLVRYLNENGEEIQEFARSVGQGLDPVLQLLVNTFKLTVENGELLANVIGVLISRMLVLKSIALAASLQQAAISAGVLTVANGKLAVSLTAAATAGKAALLSLAPLLAQLAALALAIEGVKFAKFALDMASSNDALEEFRVSVEANAGAAIQAAQKTRFASEQLNKSRADGTALTKKEIDGAKGLVAANELRIKQLQEDLKLSEQLPARTQEQIRTREAFKNSIQSAIGELERENNALKKSAGIATDTAKEKTQAVKDEESAIERVGRIYGEETNKIELAMTRRQVAIAQAVAAGTKTEEDAAREIFQIEQESLQQRIDLATEQLEKLSAIKASDPKEQQKINAEILSTEQELASARLQIAQNAAQQRQEIERAAIADLEERTQDAIAQLQTGAAERTAAIRQSQAAGVIEEQEAQEQILALQRSTTEATIAQKRAEIASLNELRAAGRIGEEEANDRILAARREVATLSIQISEQEIARRQQLLQKFEQDQQRAEAAIAQSQQQRIIAVRQAEQQGVIDAQTAQNQIDAIERDRATETIAAKQREIDQVRALRQQGVLDAETAANREQQLAIEVGQLTIQQIESETAAARKAAEEQIQIRQEGARAAIEMQQANLQARGAALQNESDLLSAQIDLQTSLSTLQQERLNTQIAQAEAAGRLTEADRLREESLEAQTTQLEAQFEAQRLQLEIKQEQRRIDLELQALAAEQAKLDAEVELEEGRANDLEDRKIAKLERILAIRSQQLGQLNKTFAGLEAIEVAENESLENTQEITREKLKQQQIQREAARDQRRLNEALNPRAEQLGSQLESEAKRQQTDREQPQIKSQEQLTEETDRVSESFGGLAEVAEILKKAFEGFNLPAIQARRNGGPVRAGQPYIVGEDGQEMFVPKQSGYILTAKETARILGQSIGGIGMKAPKLPSGDNSSSLLKEVRGLRLDLQKQVSSQSNSQSSSQNTNFTFINEQDPTRKMLEISEQMMRQRLRRQGL
ncbi:hypothetical protein H6F87_29060 [Cyanobacteria bacterium FACHB-502]|nr:hypothetical protein [Cyanobacteria bacterium FACHB-502]